MLNRRFVIYSDLKPIKTLSDFPHKAIGNHFLGLAIAPYCFAISKRNADHSFHIKGNGAKQFFSCLVQGRRLYLRDDGSKFFFGYSLRNFTELCPVFFGSAAVSVLRSPPAQISVIRCLLSYITGYILSHFYPPVVAGRGFGSGKKTTFKTLHPRPHRFTKYNCGGGFRFFRLPPITSETQITK